MRPVCGPLSGVALRECEPRALSATRPTPLFRPQAMYFRNVAAFSSTGTLRNATRTPRSSMEFCIGVPVRHQQCGHEPGESLKLFGRPISDVVCCYRCFSYGNSNVSIFLTFVEDNSELIDVAKNISLTTKLGYNCSISGEDYVRGEKSTSIFLSPLPVILVEGYRPGVDMSAGTVRPA